MALDIPMPESPGESLIKGLGAGSDLIHKMMLSRYYGQIHPSGDVANAMYVEQLKNMYGENDPRYINAKQAQDLAIQGRQSLIGYRDILNKTAPFRATSALGKLIAEGKGRGAIDIVNGTTIAGSPTGTQTTTPTGARYQVGQQYFDDQGDPVAAPNASARTPDEQTAYERAINKNTGDAATRTKLNFATNLDKTRNSINMDDLTRYSGLKGTANYLRDAAQAARGNPSDDWINHSNAVTAASLMRDQMRQFYGDSIQPKALKRLDDLTNPSTWYKDPKVAQAQWKQLNKILDIETQTYRDKGTSPIQLNSLDYNDKNGQFTTGSSSGSSTKTETGGFDPKKILDYKYGSREEFLNAFNSLDDRSKAIVTAEMEKRGLH